VNTRKLLNRSVAAVAVLVVLGYGGILWWFHQHENELIFPVNRTLSTVPDSLGLHPVRVELRSSDGVRLVGRLYRGSRPDSGAVWMLFLHGNGGNATTRTRFVSGVVQLGLSVVVADYRGYGECEGTPTEEGVYRDAAAFYGYMKDSLHVPVSRLVVYGHSLGAAVAIDLASKLPVSRLIVEGAFTSVTDMGQEMYPFLPVKLMAVSKFGSLEKIPGISAPKLIIHAADDVDVPIAHGRRLYEAARQPKMFLELKGGHNNAFERDRQMFYGGLATFLMLAVDGGTAQN
jgi:fermentation-respiration switch protein FrsA (DUF1100 family)